MAGHDASELRIAEVKGSLPTRQQPRPKPAIPQPGHRPTRAEALAAAQSMKGAASVMERIPMLGNISSWSEVAFWSPLEQTGAELAVPVGILLWHCDFTFSFGLGFGNGNPPGEGMVCFAGAEALYGPGGSVTPPSEPLTGQIWCYLEVPVSNYYLFVVQVVTELDPSYTATVECGIDALSLGGVTIPGGRGPLNYPFLVQLAPGLHRFQIQQVTGALYFYSLTAWQIPYPVGGTKS